jgi:hypothetical protein
MSRQLEQALAREGLVKGTLSLSGLLRIVVDYARRALRPQALEGGVKMDPVTQLQKASREKSSSLNPTDYYDNIKRSELRAHHLQWFCAKLAPHIYGDRAATLHVQQNNLNLAEARQAGGPANSDVITEAELEKIRARRRASVERVKKASERLCLVTSNSKASHS